MLEKHTDLTQERRTLHTVVAVGIGGFTIASRYRKEK